MRGIIFTEYLDFVETKFGYATVDQILTIDGLTDEGAYTSVGKYPFEEIVALLVETSSKTSVALPNLMSSFGEHVMGVFYKGYPDFFHSSQDAFTFLSSTEDVIHPQVLKLYPDAELPSFDIKRVSEDHLEMTYHSVRRMGDFAHGLIVGCLEHYQEKAKITQENLSEDGTKIRFKIKR